MRRTMACFVFLACAAAARAEQLPIRVYTTSDGLPRNVINRIVQDPRGFLWICTTEGLAFFDGYTFTTYGTADGLPDAEVFDLLITRRGDYWVATRKGLALFRPGAARPDQPRFTVYEPGVRPEERRVVRVEEDAGGNVWCSTDDAVYRVVVRDGRVTFERVPLSLPKAYPTVVTFHAAEDGTLWVATKNGLVRRQAGGEVVRFTTADGLPHDVITDLFDDRRGGLWVATDRGLALLDIRVQPAPAARKGSTQVQRWLEGQNVRTVIETADGTVWAGLNSGLARLGRGGEGTG
ncbi:MAG: two-component regulator propeller domain-containing protein, partial [Rhodospirillaceae bacterium]